MTNRILDNNVADEFLELVRTDKLKLGLEIGCILDDHLRFKLGTFNVILGHANVGKTYWVFWYFLMIAVKHNKRFLIFSSENTVGGLKRNLMQLLAQKKLNKFTEHDFWLYKTQIDGWFTFIDTDHLYSYQDLLKIFNDNLNNFDCCLIDPYNSLIKPKGMAGNSHEIDYQIASELRIFCRVNNKTLYVNAHASTEALRKVYAKEHELAGHPIPPNASDIEGGGKWVNRADDFIVLHRLTKHPQNWMYTDVHINKVKETETGGMPTFFDEPVRFKLHGGCQFLCKDRFGDEMNVLNNMPVKENELKPNNNFESEKIPF